MRDEMSRFPSSERPWLKYYPEGAADAAVPELSIYQMLVRDKDDILANPAISYLGRRISYGEYFDRIVRYACSLSALGVAPNEIVMTLLPNIPEARELIYAVNHVGATSYPVNPLMPPELVGKAIDINNVKVVFVFEGFLPKFGKALNNIRGLRTVIIRGDESAPAHLRLVMRGKRALKRDEYQQYRPAATLSLRDFEKLGIGVPVTEPHFERGHVAAIIGTSGTTGIPKGVCLTDDNLNAHAVQHAVGLETHPGEKLMDVLIPALAYGLCVMHYSGVLGLEAIVIPNFPTDVHDLLVKYQPDHFTGGPVHFEKLARLDERSRGALPRAKNMCSGGTSLPSWVEGALNNAAPGFAEGPDDELVYVRSGYGCSENCGACTYAIKGSYKFGGAGVPLPLVTMGVFELDTDREVGYGVRGEICATGKTVMAGYLNNPEETSSVLVRHSDGRIWLHTKDIGYVDEDGHFFLVDRAKSIFTRQGHNVHPSKVADFIASIAGVADCVVAGLPHPAADNVPVAFVVMSPIEESAEGSLEELRCSILEVCFNNLDEPSIPHDIVFVNAIPSNMGGKPDLKRLINAIEIDYETHPEPYNHGKVVDVSAS